MARLGFGRRWGWLCGAKTAPKRRREKCERKNSYTCPSVGSLPKVTFAASKSGPARRSYTPTQNGSSKNTVNLAVTSIVIPPIL